MTSRDNSPRSVWHWYVASGGTQRVLLLCWFVFIKSPFILLWSYWVETVKEKFQGTLQINKTLIKTKLIDVLNVWGKWRGHLTNIFLLSRDKVMSSLHTSGRKLLFLFICFSLQFPFFLFPKIIKIPRILTQIIRLFSSQTSCHADWFTEKKTQTAKALLGHSTALKSINNRTQLTVKVSHMIHFNCLLREKNQQLMQLLSVGLYVYEHYSHVFK